MNGILSVFNFRPNRRSFLKKSMAAAGAATLGPTLLQKEVFAFAQDVQP